MTRLSVLSTLATFAALHFACGQDWVCQAPLPTPNALTDVLLRGDSTVWAVGERGTIVHTTNLGRTWEAFHVSTQRLNSVCATSDQDVWAAGDAGVLFRTSDGGVSWHSQGDFGHATRLSAITFPNVLDGWIASSYSEQGQHGLLHTINGGDTWSLTPITNSDEFSDVFFLNGITGWALSPNEYNYYTTDGGWTWTRQEIENLSIDLITAYFVDGGMGWIGGAHEECYRTTDSGANWQRLSSPQGTILQLKFTDVRHGWAVGDAGVSVSGDSGSSWSTRLHEENTWLAGDFSDSHTGVIVGEHGRVMRTTSEGTEWTPLTESPTYALQSVSFSDPQNGWTVGTQGTILRTTDGGSHWTATPSESNEDLFGVWSTDANTVWAVGHEGVIVHSTSGGTHWTEQSRDSAYYLWAIAMRDANRGWAVGSQGQILHTENSGATWTRQTSGTDCFLNGVAAGRTSAVWAVGDRGVILHSTDNGVHWTQQDYSWNRLLYSVAAIGEDSAWAVGTDIIMRTTDGGNSWLSQAVVMNLNSVTFADGLKGWIVGRNGVVLFTTDGGVTWTQEDSGTEIALNGVTCVGTLGGWAVGEGGTILQHGAIASADERSVRTTPEAYALSAYPNPFNPTTTLELTIPRGGKVKVTVFDITGREVENLVDGVFNAGQHKVVFDGSRLSSGLYFARLDGPGVIRTQKLVLLK